MANDKKSLKAILEADIKLDDKAKALGAIDRIIRDAKQSAGNEIHSATIALDRASDNYNILISKADSSLRDIMEASRNCKLADANLTEMQNIMSERF